MDPITLSLLEKPRNDTRTRIAIKKKVISTIIADNWAFLGIIIQSYIDIYKHYDSDLSA